MDGHCAFRVRGADQRRRIPLPGCAGRGGGLAGPAIGAPAAATSGPVPSDRAHRPRLMTGPTGSQPHRYQPFRVQPRHRGRKPPVVSPHWGRLIPIGAGNHSLGQANNLPQCTVTYPNATTHLLQQCRATEKLPHCLPQCGPTLPPNVPLPTPMTHCLPQCGPALPPNVPLPTPMRARPARWSPTRPPRASGGNAPVPLITPAYRVRCAGPFLRTALTISRSRADQAPLAKRTSTEATRCCAVRSSRPVSGSEATTHSPVAEGGSVVPASTSGPTCGQAGPFAGKNHA